MRSICRIFLCSIALVSGFAGAVAAPHASDAPDMGESYAPTPVPAAEPVPAEPRVLVESAWLVPSEDLAGTRIVTGPRPADAAESLVTARFRYEGDVPAEGLRIVLEIPAELTLVADSATGPGAVVSYSVDGGARFGSADALTVPDDGEAPGALRPATPADYTHIRWDLPGEHPPGIAGLVSFRARPTEAGAGDDPK